MSLLLPYQGLPPWDRRNEPLIEPRWLVSFVSRFYHNGIGDFILPGAKFCEGVPPMQGNEGFCNLSSTTGGDGGMKVPGVVKVCGYSNINGALSRFNSGDSWGLARVVCLPACLFACLWRCTVVLSMHNTSVTPSRAPFCAPSRILFRLASSSASHPGRHPASCRFRRDSVSVCRV